MATDCVATDVAQQSQAVAFQTPSAMMAARITERPPSWHGLGPRDMSLAAERFRRVEVAIPEVRVSRGIAMSSC
jgi:hypothetical protein